MESTPTSEHRHRGGLAPLHPSGDSVEGGQVGLMIWVEPTTAPRLWVRPSTGLPVPGRRNNRVPKDGPGPFVTTGTAPCL
jgi:hypothetical protein